MKTKLTKPTRNAFIQLFNVLLLLLASVVHVGAQEQVLPIIPEPVYSKAIAGDFIFSSSTVLHYDDASKATASLFNEALARYTGYKLKVNKNTGSRHIFFKLDAVAVTAQEGYQLSISKNKIELIGHDQAGVFYGLQSLIQLFKPEPKKRLKLPQGEVRDYPRFGYRGMHLDVGRHMFPVSFLKKFIDLLALYKLNVFHWHLTEDQGWRIEIKKYPKLQSEAAWRKGTIIGHKKESPHKFDGIRYGGYYTREQIKEVVNYATSKYINVLPEIEMPGHARAALAAYPELGCTGGPYETAQFWGVFDDVFCAGNEATYTFLEGVLDEVVELFPYQYVHIGGDECPKLKWQHCPKCQQKIHENGLKDEHELQGYLMKRMEKYLQSKNRKAIGWDEVLEGGVSTATTIMNWRGEESGITAAKAKYPVIMTPESRFYFDYYQSLSQDEPIAAGNYTPLAKVYDYEPVPASLNADEAAYIKGVQGAMWSEYLTSSARAEYMVFPRLLALAETAWSPAGQKNYPHFLDKVRAQEKLLKRFKVNYFPYFDEIMGTLSSGISGTELSLSSTQPETEIRYTLDNSKPLKSGMLYTGPVIFNKTATLNAALFSKGKQVGRVFKQAYQQHLGIGKKITLAHAPAGKYALPPEMLLNGIAGQHRFNDGQWLGFSAESLDALIDLGKLENVNELGINILNYPWQRMWPPVKLSFWISADGKNFDEVYRQETFKENGINQVRAKISSVKARYVRVVAENVGRVPVGGYGEGEKAWLMADEIIVN